MLVLSCLIDEDQLVRVKVRLLLAPFDARRGNVLPVLLGSPKGLFLNVRSSFFNVVYISPMLAEIVRLQSQARNSAIVASGRLVTWAKNYWLQGTQLGSYMAALTAEPSFSPVNLRRDRTFET